MIHECDKCKADFLTEADPYLVLPKPSGIELVCYRCYEADIEVLKIENEQLTQMNINQRIYFDENEKLKLELEEWKSGYESINKADQERLDEIKRLKLELESVKKKYDAYQGHDCWIVLEDIEKLKELVKEASGVLTNFTNPEWHRKAKEILNER